jgi:hypothetical protein
MSRLEEIKKRFHYMNEASQFDVRYLLHRVEKLEKVREAAVKIVSDVENEQDDDEVAYLNYKLLKTALKEAEEE